MKEKLQSVAEHIGTTLPRASTAWEPPSSQLGPYVLGEVLGAGGMAVVYRATHRDTGACVAIKTVKAFQRMVLSSIRREIAALQQLDHPGVVRIIEHGVIDGVPWYAMQLLEGETLHAYLQGLWHQQKGSLSTRSLFSETEVHDVTRVERAPPNLDTGEGPIVEDCPPAVHRERVDVSFGLDLLAQVTAALAYVHSFGVVHRDLSPCNVFCRQDGTAVLVDFGLSAFFSGSGGRDRVDVQRDFAGTPAYVSPEQILGATVDARADLYALGCLFYELLTGQPPFVADTQLGLLQQHLARPPRPIRELAHWVPMELDRLVLELLAKQPEDRLAYAQDVLLRLAGMGFDVPSVRLCAYLYAPGFVGRDEILRDLERRLGAFRRERSQLRVISILGAPGLGKTRLVLELARAAREQMIAVHSGECLAAHEGGGPLQPFRRVLQHVGDRCRELGAEVSAHLLGHRAAVLAEIEPSLRGLPGTERKPAQLEEGSAARDRLLAFLAKTLRALSGEEPLLLLLDDVHVADPLTRAFVAGVAEGSWDCGRTLLMGVGRETSPGASNPHVYRIVLEPLSEDAVRSMVASMLATEQPPEMLEDFLVRHGDGSPFFVGELLRAAVDEGWLARNALGAWFLNREPGSEPLPTGLEEVLALRRRRLSPSAQALLKLAALCGSEIESEVLELAYPGDDYLHALEELIHRRFVTERLGVLRVAHAALHADAQSSPAASHRALAQALEAHDDGTVGRRRATAFHWESCGDEGRAMEAYTEAGYAALEACLYTDAVDLLERALALRPVHEAQLRSSYGQALWGVGEYGRACAEHERVLSLLGVTLPHTRGGMGLRFVFEGARRWFPFLSPKRDVEDHVLIAVSAELMSHHAIVNNDLARLFLLELISVNEARFAAQRAPVATSYSTLAAVLGQFGFTQLANTYLQHAHELASTTQRGLIRVHLYEGYMSINSADWTRLEQVCERGLALTKTHGDTTHGELFAMMRSQNWVRTGRFDEAYASFTEIESSARARGHIFNEVLATVERIRTLFAMGRYGEVESAFERAEELLQLEERADMQSFVMSLRGLQAVHNGEWLAAFRWARQARDAAGPSIPSSPAILSALTQILSILAHLVRHAQLPEPERERCRKWGLHISISGLLGSLLFPIYGPTFALSAATFWKHMGWPRVAKLWSRWALRRARASEQPLEEARILMFEDKHESAQDVLTRRGITLNPASLIRELP